MNSCATLFTDFSARKLRQLESRIADCLGRLADEQIWARHAETENAVGNLVLHLAGNARQWVVAAVGGREDTRKRDAEFAARGGHSGADLAAHLRAVVEEAAGVIKTLDADRLSERVTVQDYQVTVLEAVYHVVEHFAGHTGQIIYATKLMTGTDLGYYGPLKRESTP